MDFGAAFSPYQMESQLRNSSLFLGAAVPTPALSLGSVPAGMLMTICPPPPACGSPPTRLRVPPRTEARLWSMLTDLAVAGASEVDLDV